MTTKYGALVGAPKQAAPPIPVDHGYENATDHVLVRDRYELAALAAAGVIQAAVLGWETVLDPVACIFACDDLGVGGTLSFGDVTYPTALASAVNTDSAALGATSLLSAVDI